ncbi:MAG: oligosaccharide flippase family protein [bacterium]|nr:oligosaccharide flippase family protein [bacterium]
MSKLKAFIGETLIYGFANVFSRVFAMLLIPLYQGLGPDVYSNIFLLQSAFTLLSFALALNSGVFYYYYEGEKLSYRKLVLSSWFYYQVMVALLIFAGIFIFKGSLAELLRINGNKEELELAFVLLGLQLFPYILNITNINLYRIQRKPKKAVLITLAEAIFTLSFVWIGIEFFNFGLIEIVLSQFVARACVALLFINSARIYLSVYNFSKAMLKRIFTFSWPFIIISSFGWGINTFDKFIGAELLVKDQDVANLALAMQISLPIVVLSDMIRMAIGPFVMSIRKDEDAEKSYQQVFDLSIFSGFGTLVLIIIFSPLLIQLLANENFIPAMKVLPLIGLASVLSLIANQFAISFSLNKKNVYILIATVTGGSLAFLLNIFLMRDYGFVIAGISQIASFSIMAIILYLLGVRIAKLTMKLGMMFTMLGIIVGYIVYINCTMDSILAKEFLPLILVGIAVGIALIVIYFVFQKLSPRTLIRYLSKRK